MKTFIFTTVLLLAGPLALGNNELPGDRHFVVDERYQNSHWSFSPAEILIQIQRRAAEINILTWMQLDRPAPRPSGRYHRKTHFGTWIDFPNDNTCLNTRGIVLSRDSKDPIQVYPNDPCFVSHGRWYDPYTHKEYQSAQEVQIEHVVPLKNAYISGGFEWSWNARCAYTNFLGNAYHLIPIDGPTNSEKSDSGPDKWLPPNTKYHCEYVANWLRIKAVWQLRMSEAETKAIADVVRRNRCSRDLFRMSLSEITRQRGIARQFAEICETAPQTQYPTPSQLQNALIN